MESRSYDIVIIGGGVMGSAAAYYLTLADRALKVAVVERDPTYAKSSTTLSMANARIQFSLRQNVEISMYALEILETFEEEMAVEGFKPGISYRREGNLFMVDGRGREAALAALAMQQELGCRVEWWEPEQIRDRYPLYDTEGYVGGTFGRRDGHFDAYAFLMGYKAKARSQGVVYLKDEAVEILSGEGAVQGVRLKSGDTLNAGIVINCAGAWCADIARTAGVSLPVQPTNRQVFALDTAVKPDTPLPLTILPSGLYFRSETGGLILLGKSMPDDPVGYDFGWDDKRFMETLWLELAEFVPGFDRLKLVRGWGGLYAVNTLDGNAILGEWPGMKGLYLANGFSGHGLQQAPAVGRYLMELITGKPHALDLSIFQPERIIEKKPLSEGGLV
ncbi:NAD(P)/FAD-dependent oxidoreductase [Desulfococcus sp.]|uniref:NAD(P)/FAD-dependent oxidoreductase n=1 Tax=Desulfococcus sp. TaxID=2025834 RepID=UPI003593A8F1